MMEECLNSAVVRQKMQLEKIKKKNPPVVSTKASTLQVNGVEEDDYYFFKRGSFNKVFWFKRE